MFTAKLGRDLIIAFVVTLVISGIAAQLVPQALDVENNRASHHINAGAACDPRTPLDHCIQLFLSAGKQR